MIVVKTDSFQLDQSVFHCFKIFILSHFILDLFHDKRPSIINHYHLFLSINGMFCLFEFEAKATMAALWEYNLKQNSLRILITIRRIDGLI